MHNVWFTADTHFGHGNIIKYCNRPFKSSDEMDEAIVQRFASVIRPGDRLYHLGDVAWSSANLYHYFDRINTRDIHLIYGNHDKPKTTVHPYIRSYSDYKTISVDMQHFTLFHYPMRSWERRTHGGIHLYGHVHGRLRGVVGFGRSMDVGVDTNHFYPYSYDEIVQRMKHIPIYNDLLDDANVTPSGEIQKGENR